MNLIFLGPPGAGKGTQAVKIAARYGLAHISTGEMLREAIADETAMGLEAKRFIDQGLLVPDDVIIGVVQDRLQKPDCANGYLLDGFPRTVAQAEALDTFSKVDHAVLVDVPMDALMQRMTGRRVCPKCKGTFHISTLTSNQCPDCGAELVQRADDNEATVSNRLKVYEQQTKPLTDYYAARGQLRTIDGHQPVDVVFEAICEVLDA